MIAYTVINQIVILIGLAAVAAGLGLRRWVLDQSHGSEAMEKIATAIAQGSQAYLSRQYRVIAPLAAVIMIVLAIGLGRYTALGFALGAVASAVASIIGMNMAVKANIRTADAAKTGLASALNVAFRGGAVTGLLVVGMGILASAGYFYILNSVLRLPTDLTLKSMIGLGFGGSLISVFARLGGGIYTKGADVGTDMVGKIEQGIPEDDPRNPGVIADLVGDNVGDCAGMAADLFETYVATTVAAMLLGWLTFRHPAALLFPLVLGGLAIIATLASVMIVRLPASRKIMPALYRGLAVAMALSALLFFPVAREFGRILGQNPLAIWVTTLAGIGLTMGMVMITEFYTSKNARAVQAIARASQTGHGTNIISGLAVSMKATLLPVLLIVATMLVSYLAAGIYGVSLAAMAMLSLTGIVVSIDSFGPITDNAGGIAEMSLMPAKVRRVTDALDAVGNTTKAVTKAYAIASAALAALVLFVSYTAELGTAQGPTRFNLDDPYVLVGLFIGGALPYFFAALAMESVGTTGQAVVGEVRRQFATIKGIMAGKALPDYANCVDIVTRAALKEMILPALIPVGVPLIVGFTLGSRALGGLLMGTIITGIFVAISMTTGGAAWDNAKKLIETGLYGGKKSFAHQAAVTGDTVGDPYKDTAGPAINPMIKIINIVALLIAGFII